MKQLILSLTLALSLASCATIDVATDYDKNVNFNQFKSYAFYKPGIDQAEISDLDKKRILRAIDFELSNKGMVKTENPDVLISIMTDAQERVNIYQNNFGWGWGGPFWGGGFGGATSTTTIEGKLFIDVIDNSKKELVWQGIGTSSLPEKMERKEEKIKQIVNEILQEYPPAIE